MGFDWLSPKNYKRHYICLECQKGFKRPSEKDMKHSEQFDLSNLMNEYYVSEGEQDILKYISASHKKLNVVCPNCQGQMLQVHYNFEVPPQRDKNSWKSLQKEMSSKTSIKYDVYINWHLQELTNADKHSPIFKRLKQNLSKLKGESNNN